ncbi:MAG TPA: DUF1295 domain-containing protein [Flavobacteriaceae bacterium]|nr:DUF1295 domain-containing protein [Flavobacteriaceae bacterium]
MEVYYNLLAFWILFGALTFLYLIFSKIAAPYGRHQNNKWGWSIGNNWGWFWMELPALLVMPIVVIIGPAELDVYILFILFLWCFHYFYRTVIFPFKLNTKGKKIPLVIVCSGFIFNLINGVFVGYELGFILENNFSLSPNFIIGIIVFSVGVYINKSTDNKLISLRSESKGYQIPEGGLFNYISCPNHFGEIIEWLGFAIILWNLSALSFSLWTMYNLIPRALNHHQWYKQHFSNYPTNRKAVFPFIF